MPRLRATASPHATIARLARLAGHVAAATILATCTSTPTSVIDGSQVRVQNVSTATFERVELMTAEDVRLLVGALAPGATSGYQAAAVVHEYPLVRVIVGGQERILHPVEGFIDAWNPRVPKGRYTVRLGLMDGSLTFALVNDP
jgi:hypothetical protein